MVKGGDGTKLDLEPVVSSLVKTILVKPKPLSASQASAVLSDKRFVRIIAGAGTGKTETLTRRIVYLLLEKKVPPSRIVAFTFTEKAATSMKDRIYQRVSEVAGTAATARLGEMYIGTIHAYAKRLLEDRFNYGNYGVLDSNQEMAFVLRYGFALKLNEYNHFLAQGCKDFLRTSSMVWDELIEEDLLKKRAPSFFTRIKKYEQLLEDNKQFTFGRLIYLVVKKLREKPSALDGIDYLIVDEYQDINQAQAELIRIVGQKASVFVVGDPRQTIYQWRGSNEGFFHEFSSHFANSAEVVIKENRRSLGKIVDFANAFCEKMENKFDSLQGVRGEGGFVGLTHHATPENEAKWVANKVDELVKKRGLKYSDIGILFRSVNTSASPFIDEFRARSIPFLVGGSSGLFRRDEAQALGRIFCWLSEEGFWVNNRWNWSDRTVGDDLLATALICWRDARRRDLPNNVEARLNKLRAELHSNSSKHKNFTEIFQTILITLGFQDLDSSDSLDAAVMANLGRFNTLLSDFETANRFGGRQPKWPGDFDRLKWFLNSYATSSYEEQPADDLRGVNAVQIMTVHQAKGLEWPAVFLPSLVQGRFPSSQIGREQKWCDVPRDLFDVTRYEGSEEDERRLFYVAASRARDALFMSYFDKKRGTSLSDFVSDLTGEYSELDEGKPLPEFSTESLSFSFELQSLAAGEIVTYQQCPQKFQFNKVWNYQPGLNPAIGYGNSLHHCLQRASQLVKSEGMSPVSATATSVDEDFHMPFAGGEVLENMKRGAKKVLVDFSKKFSDDFKRIDEVEYRLEYPMQNATITGKVDVILRDSSELEVRDYKTSDKVTTLEQTAMQIHLYTLGLQNMEKKVSKGSVAYLEEAKIVGVDVDKKSLSEAKNEAQKAINGIINRKFKATPGHHCATCDFKDICKWRKS